LIGNAVPVNLARFVGEAIVEYNAGMVVHDEIDVEVDPRVEVVG
jgi:hypothetical protein